MPSSPSPTTPPQPPPSDCWPTAITHVEPDKILVRGYALDELMGRLSFGDAIYLLITGELASPTVSRVMDALLVASLDHGATPPSTQIGRASCRERV